MASYEPRPDRKTLEDGTRVIGTTYRNFNNLTRIYADATDAQAEERSGVKRDQLRYTQKGEDKAMDALWRKFNRAEAELRKEIALGWLVSHGFNDVKVRFQRTAGCACGCSPAVVADRTITLEGFGRVADVMVVDATDKPTRTARSTSAQDDAALAAWGAVIAMAVPRELNA
jgi:hypothetical protein